MKIGVKIASTFFLIAFLSMAVISVISYLRAKQSLEKQSFEKLTAVREMKAGQIEDYFQIINDQITTCAENPMVIDAMKDLKNGFNSINEELKFSKEQLQVIENRVDNYIDSQYISRLRKNLVPDSQINQITFDDKSLVLQDLYGASNPYKADEKNNLLSANDASSYTKAHAKYHGLLKNFLDKFGYYDIFLIDHETGNIVYTVYKEVDFTTSLITGPFRNTNLATAFKSANGDTKKGLTKLVDFQPYIASYNAQASFITCPIFDGDKKIGVLAFQMPIDKINDIMTNKQNWSKVGLGNSGETYIVGKDYTLRNQSRFLIEDSINYFHILEDIQVDKNTIEKIKQFRSSIGLQVAKTKGSMEALQGITDTQTFPDYRGVRVLSAFKPLKIMDMQWGLMSEIDEAEAFENVTTLRNNIIIAFACLLILVFITSYFVSREITRPLKELTVDALELAKGNMEVEIITGKKDEIGVLASSFKTMQSSINALINDLRHINHNLEDKVTERTAEIVEQKNIIQEKQKEIVDSIHYAQRIQTTILAKDEYLNKHLPQHFVLFKPKAIVSGDFYWATTKVSSYNEYITDNRFYLTVCDSTGHGVPGAFMSLLNISFLNEAIRDKNIAEPNEILNHVRKRLIKYISQEGGQDGMDGIIICFDRINQTITYAAAHNAPIVVRDNQIIEFKADKMPIGMGIKTDPFTLHQIEVQKDDMIYLYTDGYADQFGGPKGKKFKYKTLNNLLAEISKGSMSMQRDKLNTAFEDWRGELEQIDDVCLIGIRI
jgi:serine phosphatase RsbU (regulator of sigma subunit)